VNVLAKLTWRQFLLNKRRTLVTIIGVVLSVAMITAVTTFTVSFQDLMVQDTLRNWGNWHARFEDVEAENTGVFYQSPDVEQVMLARTLGYAFLAGSTNEAKPYLFIQALDEQCLQSVGLVLVEGRLPREPGEVAIANHIYYNGGVDLPVGEEIEVEIGQRFGDDRLLGQNDPLQKGDEGGAGETFQAKSTQRFNVVGIFERPWIEPHSAPGYTVVTCMGEESSAPVNVWVRYKKLDKGVYALSQALAARAGLPPQVDVPGEVYYPVHYNKNLFQVLGVASYGVFDNILNYFILVTIAIIMVGSISLIYNAFAISISERSRQLGMLASVGATASQKRATVFYESLAIGLFGIPLGLLAGTLGMGLTFHFVSPVLSDLVGTTARLRLVVSPLSLGAAVFFSALTIFISAWLPARRAAKVTPITAIRQAQDVKLTRRGVRTSWLTRLLFGFEASLALKNLKRNRRRYRTTVVSLTVSLVLFLTVSSYANFSDLALNMFDSGLNFDLAISWEDMGPQDRENLATISSLIQVEKHSFIRQYSGEMGLPAAQAGSLLQQNRDAEGGHYLYRVLLESLDEETYTALARAAGVKDEQPGVIALNLFRALKGQVFPVENESEPEKAAAENNKRVEGQVFKIRPGATLAVSLGGSVQEVTLLGTTKEPPLGSTVWHDPQDLVLYVREGVFNSLLARAGVAAQGGTLYIVTAKGDIVEKTARSILPADSDNWNLYHVGAAQSVRQVRQVKILVTVFVLGFIFLITGICIANIVNTISTSIALRRREFAMLKSVGMTPRGFNRMIRYESVFYGIKSLSFGLPLSLGLHYLLYRSASQGFDFGYALPWRSYLLAVAAVLAVVFTTMMYSSVRIKKENIIDALKEENL
jgi:putative ABC transport system permease protein